MAWEERNGHWYYYLKVWSNGTCQTEYFGSGPLAQIAAREQYRRRSEAEQERQELRKEQAEQDAIDKQVDELLAQTRLYVDALLLATGHHTHKRQWRKLRT